MNRTDENIAYPKINANTRPVIEPEKIAMMFRNIIKQKIKRNWEIHTE